MRAMEEMYGAEMDDMDGMDPYGEEGMDGEYDPNMDHMGESYGMEHSPGEEDDMEMDDTNQFEQNPAF